jgi:DNA invertase Pin-like site-specific DNA recombinase
MGVEPHVIRFAFAGRCSTEDVQDPEASRNWQLTRARALIEPAGGHIVTEYFDIGHSRSLPWQRRPRANQLLQALRNPNRGFDAVVIGEPQRTFYGNQFGNTFPVFVHFRIPLWGPEVGGPIDPDNEAHDLVLSVFGGMSKGERNRIKIRVRTAISSQAQLQGRYLGERPPYGYHIADAGPHPNPSKAANGQRIHKLTPDPTAAPIVQRIFTHARRSRTASGDSPATKQPSKPEPTQPWSPNGSTTPRKTSRPRRRHSTRSPPPPGRSNAHSTRNRSASSPRASETSRNVSTRPTPPRKAPSTKPSASPSATHTQRGPRP